jgi:hypothetical protein
MDNNVPFSEGSPMEPEQLAERYLHDAVRSADAAAVEYTASDRPDLVFVRLLAEGRERLAAARERLNKRRRVAVAA